MEQNVFGIEAMCEKSLDDFRGLLAKEPEGWCWCVAWEVPTWEGWSERLAADNHKLREKLWANHEYYGYIFYLNGAPVGWCRVGPTSAWPKLVETRGVESSDECYVFTCFNIRPEHRGKGYLHKYFKMAISDLQKKGVRQLLGIPRKINRKMEAGDLWNGPKPIFDKAGFHVVREADEYYEVRKYLQENGG